MTDQHRLSDEYTAQTRVLPPYQHPAMTITFSTCPKNLFKCNYCTIDRYWNGALMFFKAIVSNEVIALG